MTIKNNTLQHSRIQTIKATHIGVTFHVSMPSGLRTVKEVGNTIAEVYKVKDKRRVTGKVNVFATPELQEAARIRSGLRSSFRAQTACGLEDNIRICPVIQSDKVQTWFDNARTNLDDFYFQKVVPSILARKEEDREAAIEIAKTPGYEGGIGTLFNERLYPADEAELREKYSLTLRWHPLPDPEHDVRVGCSVEQAKKFAADEISRHEKLAASAHRDVIERIEKSLNWYSDRLGTYTGERKGSFRDEGFKVLAELSSILPGFNIYNDPAFDAVASKIVKDVATLDPEDLRGKSASSEARRKQAKVKVDAILSEVEAIKSSDEILADVLGN